MADASSLEIRRDNKILMLTLNRPEVRNAFTAEMNTQMAEAILAADFDDDIAMIAITGAGDKAFCSGADLNEARQAADAGEVFRGPLRTTRRGLFEVMIDSKKPIMAIVNGPAIAGGFELALAADIRIAAEDAYFALPEAKRARGAHFASVVLPQMVPPGIAMEWLYTGCRIPLDEAERWGLINRRATATTLMDTAMDLAAEILTSAPLSLQRMKLTYRKTFGMPLLSALRLDVGPDVYGSEDQVEGARAYLEKRDPVWKGR